MRIKNAKNQKDRKKNQNFQTSVGPGKQTFDVGHFLRKDMESRLWKNKGGVLWGFFAFFPLNFDLVSPDTKGILGRSPEEPI